MREWEQRKQFVGFDQTDAALLMKLRLMAVTYGDAVVEELYRRFFLFPQVKAFFNDDATIGRVKQAQKEYFIELTDGEYGEKYLRSRLRIGRIHHAIGLSPQWYVGAYSIYTQLIFPHVVAAFRPDFALAQKAFGSLLKLVLLDTELALTAYIAAEVKKRTG